MGYKKVKKTRTAYRTEIRDGVSVQVPFIETYETVQYVSESSYSSDSSSYSSDSFSSGGSGE